MGSGVRFIPDRSCVDQFILVPNGQFSQFSQGLYEDWVSGNYIRKADGTSWPISIPISRCSRPAGSSRATGAI